MSLDKMDLDIKTGGDVELQSPGQVELTIDPAAEKRLLRKLDMFLSPMMVLFFLVAYLDRSNIGKPIRCALDPFLNVRLNNHIGNAAVAGMTTDLGLEGNQLNVAVTVFYGTLNI